MFASRSEAGKLLGERLGWVAFERPIVLGITRGGVVVAAEVAKILKAPLYPLVIKKISSPLNPEYALGAMGPDGRVVSSKQQVVSSQQIKDTRDEIKERMKEYGVRNLGTKIKNKTVIIVDDGVATGWTVKAGIQYAQSKKADKIIVAVPVADREVVRQLASKVDRLIVLETVDGLGAVGNFYEEFGQVTDEEVKLALSERCESKG